MSLQAQWQAAEQALAVGTPIELITASLPPRLAWLLRGIDAFDKGTLKGLRATAAAAHAAGEADVAAMIFEMIGEQLPPQETQRETQEETPPLKVGPLTAALLQLHQAESLPEKLPTYLDDRVSERRMLKATLQLIAGGEKRIYKDPVLNHFLPRAEQVRVAATVLSLHGTVNGSTLARAFPERLLTLPPARWPDLAIQPTILFDWVVSSEGWGKRQDQGLRAALRSPGETRKRLLRGILLRLDKMLLGGDLINAQEPAWAAQELADTLPDLGDLSEQLLSLRLRLQWVEEEVIPGELLASLWTHHPSLSATERLSLSKTILGAPTGGVHPATLMGARLFLMARTLDPTEASSLLEDARHIEREALEEALENMKAPAARVLHLSGLHAAFAGDPAEAFNATATLLEAGEASSAEALLFSTLRSTPEGASLPGLTPVLELLSKVTLSHDFIPLLLGLLQRRGGVPALLWDVVDRSLSDSAQDTNSRALKLFCAHLIGDEERTKTLVRDLGRTLRATTPSSAAEDMAIEIIARVLFWGDARDKKKLRALLKPLSKFLLRKSKGDTTVAAALRCSERENALLRGCVQWYLWNRGALGEDPKWFSLCHQVVQVPARLAELGARLVRAALAENPPNLEHLRTWIREKIAAILNGEPPP